MPRSLRSRTRADAAFWSSSDAADASITDLAEKFHMTRRHGDEKSTSASCSRRGSSPRRRSGVCGPASSACGGWRKRAAWIEQYRQLWDERFDELDKAVEELKRKEKADGRKKRK